MLDMKEAENYFDLITSECYQTKYEEIQDKQVLNKLTDLQLAILKGGFEKRKENYTKMSNIKVVDYSMQILRYMYESYDIGIKLDNIPGMIATTGGNNPTDGSYCKIGDKEYLMFETISYLEAIPSIIHESTHYLTPRLSTPNFHQTEILPITAELIGTDLLDELNLKNESLLFNNLEERLYHLKRRLIEKIEIADMIEKSTNMEELANLKLLLETRSQILYTYLTSFIYSYSLYQEFINQGYDVLFNINETIDNIRNVSTLISRYDLELHKKKSIEEMNSLIKKLS